MSQDDRDVEYVKRNDPRLKLPTLTVSGQKSMGFSYVVFAFLPLIPMLISIEAEGELLQILQYALYVTIGIWALIWNGSFNQFSKAINNTPLQRATLIDKFIFENTKPNAEQRINRILTYEFEAPDKEGYMQRITANYYVYSGAEFSAPLGSELTFHTIPINRRLAKLGNLWSDQWCLYTRPEQFRALKMNLLRSSLWLMLFSGATLWLRATLVQLDIFIVEFGEPSHWSILQSEQPLMTLEGTVYQIPGVWCALGVSLAFFLLVLWRLLWKNRL